MEYRSALTRDEQGTESGRDLQGEDLLAPSDAARIAARSVRTIRRAYSSGQLRAFRDRGGRGVRIRYADLRDWMLGEEISPTAGDGERAETVITRVDAPPGSREQSLALLRTARSSRRSRGAPTYTVS